MTILGFVLSYGLLAVLTLALVRLWTTASISARWAGGNTGLEPYLEPILGTTRPREELVFGDLTGTFLYAG